MYSLYTSQGVPGYWKIVFHQVLLIYFMVVERDTKHLRFN